MDVAEPAEGKRGIAMDVFESLTNIFRKLFLDLRAGPDAGEPDEDAERPGNSSGGWGTRCVNPDIGCPFEAS